MIELAKLSNAELLQKLDTIPSGLENEIAQIRLRAYGKNKINAEKPKTNFQIIAKSFLDPFVLVLFLLMVVSFATQDIESGIVMALMITVSVSISLSKSIKPKNLVKL